VPEGVWRDSRQPGPLCGLAVRLLQALECSLVLMDDGPPWRAFLFGVSQVLE
jgi:hypothetical protein